MKESSFSTKISAESKQLFSEVRSAVESAVGRQLNGFVGPQQGGSNNIDALLAKYHQTNAAYP